MGMKRLVYRFRGAVDGKLLYKFMLKLGCKVLGLKGYMGFGDMGDGSYLLEYG